MADGSTLRVTTTEDPNEIAVEWPGSPKPVVVSRVAGAISSRTAGDEWTVLALFPCPGDSAAHIRAYQSANPALRDEMGLVNGLAMVVVPPLVPPSRAVLPDTNDVTVETRDANGYLLNRGRQIADVVASDEEGRPDDLAEGTSPSPPPGGVEETIDGPPFSCEDGR